MEVGGSVAGAQGVYETSDIEEWALEIGWCSWYLRRWVLGGRILLGYGMVG
jgi:hypothetical protein